MAKYNKPNKPAANAPTGTKPKPVAQLPQGPVDRLERPAHEGNGTPMQQKIFWGAALLVLLVMMGLSFGTGINADDKFQVDYSQKLVNYYGTFGKDTAALNIPDGNMHLYGGFFEIVTGFVNKALGYGQLDIGYHHVRHCSSAILGWVAILCAALFARLIAGWQAGFFTLVLMALSPRFVGDSMMNPKDIPFAAGYIMALYNMAAVFNRLPALRWWNLAGMAGGLAIALATRAGGLLPFAMLFLFAGLHFLMKNGGFSAFSNGKLMGRYAAVTLGAAAAGYVLAVLFWPYALQNPFKNALEALSKFAALEVKIRVLFEGVNMMSDKTPWYYPAKWILLTVPLAALAGFVGSLVWLPRFLRQYNPLWVLLALFACVFPVFYVIYKNSVLHDGWRHLTFAYPPLAVLAGIFWSQLSQTLADKGALRYASIGAFALLLADAGAYIASNPKFPYTYFNPTVGGIHGAYGRYETDYWGVSTRQGCEWLESQGILKPGMTDVVVIATNMYYPVSRYLAKYGDRVKIKYLKWEKRCDDAWDYAIYPTRYIDGSTLQKGFWPPDNAVHIVKAWGTPLLAVLKDNGRNCTLGMAAAKLGDWQGTIQRLEAETKNVPDNDLAWANLGQAYLNADRLEDALAAAQKALDISPDDSQANNLVGLYWMNKNDAGKAKAQFELAIKKEPSNAAAWYYLAIIAQSQNNTDAALANLQKALDVAPNFMPAYQLAAQIYEGMGDMSRANQIRQMMQGQ